MELHMYVQYEEGTYCTFQVCTRTYIFMNTFLLRDVLTFSWASLPVGLVDVDVSGEAKVGDLAELPLPHQHVPGSQVTVHKLQHTLVLARQELRGNTH